MNFPVLTGDIGGTNARFEIVSDRFAEPRSFGVARVRDFETVEDAIQAQVLDHTAEWPRSTILAAAGPIEADGLDLTNSPWTLDPARLMETTGVADVVLLNDFEAQAFALTALRDEDYLEVGRGTRIAGRNAVVLGPGTGLGVAGLVKAGGRWVPVPGEGGHVDLGPRSPQEAEIWRQLETIAPDGDGERSDLPWGPGPSGGRVSAEQILCGRGIINLYGAIERARGVEGGLKNETCEPATISIAAVEGSDEISVATMELFCTCLGRVAGDLALTFMARGGVHIGGGIAQKIAGFVQASGFRAAFEDKAPHHDIMRTIGTAIVMDPLPALKGLAAFACAPDNYAVDMSVRHWSREDAK